MAAKQGGRQSESTQEQAITILMTCVSAVLFAQMLNWGFDPNLPTADAPWVLHVSWWAEHVVMTLAGLACGGMALRTSKAMAKAFRRGEAGVGVANLIGALLFGVPEVWASLVARAHNFPLADADKWLLNGLGFTPSLSISPTLLVVAILPPLAGFFIGISHQDTEDETVEEIQRRADIEVARKQANARKRNATVEGFVGTAGIAGKQLFQQLGISKAAVPGEQGAGFEDGKGMGSNAENHGLADGESVGYQGSPSQPQLGQKAPVSMRKGQWTSRELRGYAQEHYGADVSELEAARAMSVLSDGMKNGTAYVASRAKVKAWVDRKYGSEQANGTLGR